MMDLAPYTIHQGRLFDASRLSQNSVRVMAAFDAPNQRFGRDTVRLGSACLAPRWAMRDARRQQDALSYDKWDALPKAHAN